MFIMLQVQWLVLLLATRVVVVHSMPRSRGRGAPRGHGAARGRGAARGLGKACAHAAIDAGEEYDMSRSFLSWRDRKRMRKDEDMRPPSIMTRYLVESWGFGLKSAKVVQREAAMAVADGANHKDLIMLAQLGNAVHDPAQGSKLQHRTYSHIM